MKIWQGITHILFLWDFLTQNKNNWEIFKEMEEVDSRFDNSFVLNIFV